MRVITRDSIWIFNEDAMIFSRFPRNGEGQGKDHRSLSYQRIGKPVPYLELERGIYHGGDRIKVTAVERDQCCYTGEIMEVL